MKCLDTTFLIDFLKQDKGAVKKAAEIENDLLCTTSINVFETLLGSYKKEELTEFEISSLKQLLKNINVLPFDFECSFTASKLNADLIKEGQVVNLGDVLILGILKANNCSEIITKDKHFLRMKGIKVVGY